MGSRTATIIVAATLALLSACGPAGSAPRSARAADSIRAAPPHADSLRALPTIVFLGTSLTAGLGLDPDSAFTALIQRRLDSLGLHYTVVNAGVSGESSAGALRRIDWILRQSPAFLIIETGANDGLRGQSPDSVRANIQAMIDRVRAASPATRIVLAGMEALPNLGAEYVRQFRAIFPALARADTLPLIPFLLAGVAGVDSLNQQDGIHPNVMGERLVADNIWHTLEPLLR
jgi:acyl-CoA thioesterase I